MKIGEIINEIELFAPLAYQENYDNSGLTVGDPQWKAKGALLCFDVTLEVVDEAIKKNLNLIISHHPVIFNGLKSLTGKSNTEKVVIHALKNDIALYSAHTNLDSVIGGISWKLALKLGLQNLQILSPVDHKLVKLVCFIPSDYSEEVRQALFDAGAGHIGKYDSCSFKNSGTGSFRAGAGATPYVGEINELHEEPEDRLEVIVEKHRLTSVIKAMKEVHPYEEVAYDIYPLELTLNNVGLGVIGDLQEESDLNQFFSLVKDVLSVKIIKYNSSLIKKVKRIAVCGGAGSHLIKKAIASQADLLITGDCKYHQFIDVEDKIILADIGHYESEYFVDEIIYDILSKKFPKFAIYLSTKGRNPISYF